jgi:hypothetical protein
MLSALNSKERIKPVGYLPIEVKDIPEPDAMTVYNNGVLFQINGDKFELHWLEIFRLIKENLPR